MNNVLTINGKKWKVTGEFRVPEKGEFYLSLHSAALLSGGSMDRERNILKPVKWQPEDGDCVYLVEPQNNALSQVTFRAMWQPEYEQGFIRETKEEAEALLKGLFKFAKEFV